MRNSISNPFISCTARDMSYSDVEIFWCPPYECYKLDEGTLEKSSTPVIIEGARGSGKTMLLKHLSFFCKKEGYKNGSILKNVETEGYLGIYFRYSANYGSLFSSLNCSKQIKDLLFSNYFQLCYCVELGKILSEVATEIDKTDCETFFSGFSALCGEEINECRKIVAWAEKNINKQDELIRNSMYSGINQAEIQLPPNILFSFVDLLHDSIRQLKNTLFVFIIDEYENISSFQYIINTFIKQLDGLSRYTFRIGVRPEGIIDYKTNVGSEYLQEGRDYLLSRLVVNSDDRSTRYRKFVESVINRRLETVPIFCQLSITIDKLLGKKEDYEWEANYHMRGKHLKIADFVGSPRQNNDGFIEGAIHSDSALEEAYFLMRIKRGISIDNILQTRQDLLEGKDTALTKKYKLDMQGKYKPALLFWIIDKQKAKKLYYSLSTYLYLSCGSIYDFIGLCRTLFDELESDYFKRIDVTCQISPEIQTKAARKYGQSQLDKVKLNPESGLQMWYFAQNMCSLFSIYHKGDLCTKYPETNQFFVRGTFQNNGINREIWRSLIKWGIVIKKTSIQRASISNNGKGELYYINKLYYPLYNISCRIRGGFNFELSDTVWDEMIVSLVDPVPFVKTTSKIISQHSEENIKYNQLLLPGWQGEST